MDIIFKAIVGSHAYGTNIEGSDIDRKGVYIQSPEDVLERGYREEVRAGKDEVYYEIRRFVELAAGGNPTVLELLYSPPDCIEEEHPLWELLKSRRDEFLSLSCKYSFGGYAYAQIQKARGLDKKMNWEKEKTIRKTVLDFCYVLDPDSHFKSMPVKDYLKREGLVQEDCGLAAIDHFRYTYNLFYDYTKNFENQTFKNPWDFKGIVHNEETSNDICLSDIPEYCIRKTVLFFNKDAYSTHCKDYKQYEEWLAKRNVQRYIDVAGHGQKIDGKNLLHCVRLLETGLEIAEQKTINVRRPNAEYLIGIRKGKYDLEEILDSCSYRMEAMDEAFDKSGLPSHADRGELLKLVTKIRGLFYNDSLKTKDKLFPFAG